jgi:hypothetical protein
VSRPSAAEPDAGDERRTPPPADGEPTDIEGLSGGSFS